MEYPSVFIVIVNYNGWKDTIECLESLQNISYPNYQIVVVDNNSLDGSIEKIKQWCFGGIKVDSDFVKYREDYKPVSFIEYKKIEAEAGGNSERERVINSLDPKRRLVLIKSDKNLGFSGGNNIGIRYSLSKNADYIMLLNNDTVVEYNFVEPLIEVAEKNDNVGIVGGKIFYYDKPNSIASAGGKISIIRGSGYHYIDDKFKDPTPVSFLTGCLWLVNAGVFRQIGFLDEYYFFCVEDVDFCFRAQKYGYSLIYQPRSVIYHKEGSSIKNLSCLLLYYVSRNRPYFVHKNIKNTSQIILFWCFYIPTRLLKIIKSGRKGKYIIKGLIDFYKSCKIEV